MTFIELLIAALATWEIVEIWHHSELLSPWRARIELMENKLGKLLTCMFCLTPWVALVVVIFSLPSSTDSPSATGAFYGGLLGGVILGSVGVAYHWISMIVTVWPIFWTRLWVFLIGFFFLSGLLALGYTLITPDNLIGLWWSFVVMVKLAISAFAVARLANFFNDVTHSITRTPNQTGWWQHQMGGDPKTGFEEEEQHERTSPRPDDTVPPGTRPAV